MLTTPRLATCSAQATDSNAEPTAGHRNDGETHPTPREPAPLLAFSHVVHGPWSLVDAMATGAVSWHVPSATLTGPGLDAISVMPGTEWTRTAPDGVRRHDLRLTLQSADCAVINFRANALIRDSRRFLDALTAGAAVSPDELHMRLVARFETGDHRYSWLTQSLFVGKGRIAEYRRVAYDLAPFD